MHVCLIISKVFEIKVADMHNFKEKYANLCKLTEQREQKERER